MAEIDPHFREHDPILDANHCERCNAALRHTFILLGDLDLAPKDATELAKKIREIALGLELGNDGRPYTHRFENRPNVQMNTDARWTRNGETWNVSLSPRIEDVVDAEFADAEIDIPLPPR